MQCMYDQSHQTLSITRDCSIPLGQTKIYNLNGEASGQKRPEEENTSGGGKHLCLLRTSQQTASLPFS